MKLMYVCSLSVLRVFAAECGDRDDIVTVRRDVKYEP
jgi:hypothetical protein